MIRSGWGTDVEVARFSGNFRNVQKAIRPGRFESAANLILKGWGYRRYAKRLRDLGAILGRYWTVQREKDRTVRMTEDETAATVFDLATDWLHDESGWEAEG